MGQVSTSYRVKFSNKFKDSYSNLDISSLLFNYINGIDEQNRSIYDNIDSVQKFIVFNKILYVDIINRIKEVKPDATELDLIDIIRYMSYYSKLDYRDVIKVLSFSINDDAVVSVSNSTYVWNKRKNYFNEIQRGLSYYLAIDIIQKASADNIKTIDGNTYIFGFIDDNIFLVVEITTLDVIRIKSFRRSDYKEYAKIIGV